MVSRLVRIMIATELITIVIKIYMDTALHFFGRLTRERCRSVVTWHWLEYFQKIDLELVICYLKQTLRLLC